MYIERVHIKDLRCFADAEIDFVHPDTDEGLALPNVTLLLGDNGAGKTTVLRAVALGALNVALAQAGYVPYSMIRRAVGKSPELGKVEAHIVTHNQDLHGQLASDDVGVVNSFRPEVEVIRLGDVEAIHPRIEVADVETLQNLSRHVYADDSPGVLVLGYGATRRVDPPSEFSPSQRRRRRVLRYERVSSLFEEQVALAPIAGWLPELHAAKPKLYSRICELFDRLIPSDTRFTGELDGDEYLFERGGIKVGFAALSDGYRGYVGLLGDIFYHLCRGLTDDDDPVYSRGIVLIDEIGLHLHPNWQRVVVSTLARTLPKLQFILTTHSPIVAGTVYARNIRLLETDERGLSHLEPLDEEIHGLNADQVLLTEAFGLRSSRSPDFVEQIEQARRKLDPDNWKDALKLMRMMNRGSAGEAEPEPGAAPDWADEASRKLAGILSAEDRPGTPRKIAKKKAAAKRASKKKPTKR